MRHPERKHRKTNRTEYMYMVSWGMGYYNGIWRRVYEQDGKYIVKYNGEIWDVTDAKSRFVKD